MRTALSALFRLALVLWVGGIAIFTFLLTPAIFGHFPRDEAGRIVGVLFPIYFPYLTLLSVLALLLFSTLRGGRRRRVQGVALALLVAAVAANSANQFWIHPKARALKAKIHFAGTLPAEEAPLRQQFGRLHGASMALNLLVFLDGVVLLLGDSRWWREETSRATAE